MMGIVTDKLVYGALSWTALDKNANDRGIKDTHTSDDVGILWAADTIATQAATIEALESKLDYPHEEIAELEEHNQNAQSLNGLLELRVEELEALTQRLISGIGLMQEDYEALVEAARAVLTLPVPSNIQALAALIGGGE